MKKRGILTVLMLMLSGLLAACGGSSKGYDSLGSEAAVAEEMPVEEYDGAELNAYTEEAFMADEAAGETAQKSTISDNRKMIRTVNLDVETKNYDKFLVNVENRIKELDGYIEALECYGENYRHASMTARIPADRLDGFIKQIGETANVTGRSESVEDVTLRYVDLDSHARMLEEEQERLLELLETAVTIEDMITIESRLGEIRYQLESMKSQIRTFDNQVTYSTVHINVDEVIELTPVVKLSDTERMAQGFAKSVADVLHGIKEFVIGFIIRIPYIIAIAVAVVIILLLARVFMKLADKYSAHIAKEHSQRSASGKDTGLYVKKPDSFGKKKSDIEDKNGKTE